MNVTDAISTHAHTRPHDLALVTLSGRLNWAELEEKVNKIAAFLDAKGIVARQCVAITLRDQVLHLFVSLALARLGVAQIALPPSDPAPIREGLAARLGVAAVIVERFEDGIDNAPSIVLRLEDVEALVARQAPPKTFTGDETFLFLQSSGTTGAPKFAELTHKMAFDRFARYKTYFGTSRSDIFWPASRLDFVVAKQRVYHCLQAGAAVCVISGRPINTILIHFLNEAGVTLACGTPSHMVQILDATDAAMSMPTLRAFEVRSATVTEALRLKFKKRVSPNLFVAYATNEAEVITLAQPELQSKVADTVGHPVVGMSVEVVDEDGNQMPSGEAGLIRISGKGVVSSYLENPEATAKSFRDGWFYPGDNGRFVGDALVFLGRSDDMMIFDGMNIYPVEIENALMEHPSVKEAAAFPLRHHRFQDLPVAAVILSSPVAVEELNDHCMRRLGYKRPQLIKAVKKFPRNAMGKIMKRELGKMFLGSSASLTDKLTYPQPVLKQAQPPNSPHQVNLKFQPPRIIDTDAIDTWLSVLNPNLFSDAADECTPDNTEKDPVGLWLAKIMLLAREFLHVLRVPIFQSIVISECSPTTDNSGRLQVMVYPPNTSLVPPDVFFGVLKFAFKMAVRLNKMDAESTRDREAFFQEIDKGIFKAFAKHKTRRKSTFEVLRVAHSMGIPFRQLTSGLYQLGWGNKSRRVDGSTTDHDSKMGFFLTTSKVATATMLRQAGLPAPLHEPVKTMSQARDAAERIGYPVVIKPADSERGEGVAVDVQAKGLEAALKNALNRSPGKMALVEKQVPGMCHRLFITGSKLLYAVKRMPIGVYANGVSSIASLVDAECEAQRRTPPWKRSGIRPLYETGLDMLQLQGLRPDSVPQIGHFVSLRRIETTEWGGVDEDVTHKLHPDNVKAAIDATELLGLETAGVDIISSDITQPWHTNGAIINEVNFAPLLGGGDISRGYIKEYIARLIEGDGRIPVEVFVGGDAAWKAALERRKSLGGDEAGIYVTSATQTLDGIGDYIQMPFQGLAARSQALLMSPRVNALILVVQDDEFLHTEVPVDRITRYVEIDGNLRSYHDADASIEEINHQRLRALCSRLVG